MADGFRNPHNSTGPGVLGPNQDPCVFSTPWPPFHSFCRIDGARGGADQQVVRSGQVVADNLATAVTEGDLIIYGKTTPASGKDPRSVWVDAVVVVADTFVLPTTKGGQKKRPFNLGAASNLPSRNTDAYRYNLSDAEPGRTHEATQRDPHVGIRGVVDATPEAVAELRTSFVPLADLPADGQGYEVCHVCKAHVGAAPWDQLLWLFEHSVFAQIPSAGRPRGGWISEFESFDTAKALLEALVRRSGLHQNLKGTVAVPPLTPTAPPKRWVPRLGALVDP